MGEWRNAMKKQGQEKITFNLPKKSLYSIIPQLLSS